MCGRSRQGGETRATCCVSIPGPKYVQSRFVCPSRPNSHAPEFSRSHVLTNSAAHHRPASLILQQKAHYNMRLASLSLLLAALPAITSAAAFADAHGPRGPARTERDADLTSWRGQDRIGEYTITAYAGDVVEFVRDALAPLGQVEGDDGLGKMTNAERLKRKLKIAKPAKMRRSGGDAPTRARREYLYHGLGALQHEDSTSTLAEAALAD